MLPAHIFRATLCNVNKLTCIASFGIIPNRANSKYQPYTELLSAKLKPEELLQKYARVAELQNAPERIKKIFQVDHGTEDEVRETLIEKLMVEVHDNADTRNDVLCEVVNLTVEIRSMQETFCENKTQNQHLKLEIMDKIKYRKELLNRLRDYQFKLYVQALNVLEIQHLFEPEHVISKSELADDIGDMRIRAFAESRRLVAEQKKREEKLSSLKENIKKDIAAKKL